MCLVGYIAGRSPGFKALQNLIVNSWHCEASLTIHESGWLIFKFAKDTDKLNVLSGGPYLVYGRPLILRTMPEYFDFSSSAMHTIPVWVKFPNLPLKCWSLKCLSKIDSVLGKPVQSDMLTSTMSRLSYARVLVKVNLLSDLRYSIEDTLPNGSLLHQQVIYETLPWFCKHCKTLGHLTSTCPKAPPSKVPSPQQAHETAPVLNSTKDRDSVFNRLGPQQGSPVVVYSEANLPTDCAPPPMQVEAECVSESGVAAPNSGGWELVQSKRVRRKVSPSRQPHVVPCPTQGHSHLLHRDHQLPPSVSGSLPTSAPAPNDLTGFRTDKGKSVVVPGAPCPPISHTAGMPPKRKAQQRTGGVYGRGEGLPPPSPS